MYAVDGSYESITPSALQDALSPPESEEQDHAKLENTFNNKLQFA